MAIDKSKWNLKVNVSQKTIDEIKKMGMTKALKTAQGASAASKSDASAKEWTEGLRRMYGADKIDRMGNTTGGAKSANTKAPLRKPAGAYTKGATKSGTTVTTGKSSTKSSTKSTPAKKTLANYNNDTNKLPNNMSTAGKSQPTKGLTPQKVAKAGLAVAALVATKGKVGRVGGLGKVSEAALKAAKSAPKAAAATVKVGAKGSFGKTTKTLAKSKLGTPSEYASRAAQFGGPTNMTVKKSLAKKAAAKKAGKK